MKCECSINGWIWQWYAVVDVCLCTLLVISLGFTWPLYVHYLYSLLGNMKIQNRGTPRGTRYSSWHPNFWVCSDLSIWMCSIPAPGWDNSKKVSSQMVAQRNAENVIIAGAGWVHQDSCGTHPSESLPNSGSWGVGTPNRFDLKVKEHHPLKYSP